MKSIYLKKKPLRALLLVLGLIAYLLGTFSGTEALVLCFSPNGEIAVEDAAEGHGFPAQRGTCESDHKPPRAVRFAAAGTAACAHCVDVPIPSGNSEKHAVPQRNRITGVTPPVGTMPCLLIPTQTKGDTGNLPAGDAPASPTALDLLSTVVLIT